MASAGIANALLMRQNELTEGIDVTDHEGRVYGRSQLAAQKSLTEVALTRIALPMPILLLPPYIMEGMKHLNWMPKHRVGKVVTELCTS